MQLIGIRHCAIVEQTGEFDEARNPDNQLQVIVRSFSADMGEDEDLAQSLPACVVRHEQARRIIGG